MEHLRCVVERITYQNADNGYTVFEMRRKELRQSCYRCREYAGTYVGSFCRRRVSGR